MAGFVSCCNGSEKIPLFSSDLVTADWVSMQQIIKMQEGPSPSGKQIQNLFKNKSEEELQH